MARAAKPIIFTVGHSTRSIEDFIEILKAHNIKRLIDIRTIPKSRHNPQFNGEDLARMLRNRNINYRHMKALGGLRHTTSDSPNVGWHNRSFRGYADYMLTAEFDEALQRLIELSKQSSTAVMCAESVPWRCHRSLVADALTNKGYTVKHVMSKSTANVHKLSPMATKKHGKLIYT